jgi:hypothetical protein
MNMRDDLKALSGEVVLDAKHDYLGRIIPATRLMHQIFRERFETFSPRKQANYLRDRVAEFDGLLKEVDRQIANKQRAIRNNGQEWAQRSGYPAIIELLNDFTRPMVERELHLITRFQAAFERMVVYEEKRKASEAIWQAKRRTAEQELAKLEKDAKLEEARLNNLREEVNRYRRVQQIQEHQPHFLTATSKRFTAVNSIRLTRIFWIRSNAFTSKSVITSSSQAPVQIFCRTAFYSLSRSCGWRRPIKRLPKRAG